MVVGAIQGVFSLAYAKLNSNMLQSASEIIVEKDRVLSLLAVRMT